MYELNAPINVARMSAIATGHSQTLERWEDGPNGRRSGMIGMVLEHHSRLEFDFAC